MKLAHVTLRGKSQRTLKRYLCRECKKTFTPVSRKLDGYLFGSDVKQEAVRLYFCQKGSFRSVARQLSRRCSYSIDAKRAWALVIELAAICADPLEVARALKPNWSGFLGIDSKSVFIKDEEWHLLLAVDTGTRDILHFLLRQRENYLSYEKLLWEVAAEMGYPLRGIVSDLDPTIEAVVEQYYGRIPYQKCLVHVARTAERILPKRKRTLEQEVFKAMFDSVIWAETHREASYRLEKLLSQAENYQGETYDYLRGMLVRNFTGICTHFHCEGLPSTNNIAEGVVGQLAGKLWLTRGFETYNTAYALIKLLIFWYRTKPFTDSTDTVLNGKCPLEIAGVDLAGVDWIKLSQKLGDRNRAI